MGSLALIVLATRHPGRPALGNGPTVGPAAASALLFLEFHVNSAWRLLAGAASGLAWSLAGWGRLW